MLRLLAIALAAITALATSVTGSSAYESWCFDDPILEIAGSEMRIVVGVMGTPEQVQRMVKSAEVTVIVPAGVTVTVLERTAEYFKEKVKVRRSPEVWSGGTGVPVLVEVRFHAKQELPARATVTFGGAIAELTGTTSGLLSTSLVGPAPAMPAVVWPPLSVPPYPGRQADTH